MSLETQKALERVRKLLALAGNNPNEHEAAAAAERAQAIMAEHNLTIGDVSTTDDVDEEIIEDETLVTNSQPWRRRIGTAVAEMFFCTYVYDRLPLHRDRHSFIGKRSNVEVAKMFFTYLHMTVNRLAQGGALKRKPKERSAYRTEFRRACTSRLASRIYHRVQQAKRGEMKSDAGQNLPALLDVYETAQKQIASFMDKTYGEGAVKESKAVTKRTKTFDYEAAIDGRKAGDTIGLDQQVGITKQQRLS